MRDTRLALFADLDEAARHLAPSQSSKTDSAGRYDLRDLVKQGAPYRIVDEDGRHLAALVLQPFGQVLWITAAAGRAGRPLCPVITQHAADQARRAGLRRIAFRTERAGLVKRAYLLGYDLVSNRDGAYIMQKEIQ
jgi:hypothetical protein